jgi:hypothetical protein
MKRSFGKRKNIFILVKFFYYENKVVILEGIRNREKHWG